MDTPDRVIPSGCVTWGAVCAPGDGLSRVWVGADHTPVPALVGFPFRGLPSVGVSRPSGRGVKTFSPAGPDVAHTRCAGGGCALVNVTARAALRS